MAKRIVILGAGESGTGAAVRNKGLTPLFQTCLALMRSIRIY